MCKDKLIYTSKDNNQNFYQSYRQEFNKIKNKTDMKIKQRKLELTTYSQYRLPIEKQF